MSAVANLKDIKYDIIKEDVGIFKCVLRCGAVVITTVGPNEEFVREWALKKYIKKVYRIKDDDFLPKEFCDYDVDTSGKQQNKNSQEQSDKASAIPEEIQNLIHEFQKSASLKCKPQNLILNFDNDLPVSPTMVELQKKSNCEVWDYVAEPSKENYRLLLKIIEELNLKLSRDNPFTDWENKTIPCSKNHLYHVLLRVDTLHDVVGYASGHEQESTLYAAAADLLTTLYIYTSDIPAHFKEKQSDYDSILKIFNPCEFTDVDSNLEEDDWNHNSDSSSDCDEM